MYTWVCALFSVLTDPRCWTREHVALWLHHSAIRYRLDDVQSERFPMNGKGLLLMTKDMFLYRVSEGGGLLYEDLQLKLQRVFKEVLRQATQASTTVTCAS